MTDKKSIIQVRKVNMLTKNTSESYAESVRRMAIETEEMERRGNNGELSEEAKRHIKRLQLKEELRRMNI